MIDVDALEDQLERALAANLGLASVAKPPPKAAPPPAPVPPPLAPAPPPPPLPPQAPQPSPFRVRSGSPEDPQRPRNDEERFRLILERGDEDEQYELLEDCRRRAYTYGDLRWRGALTLLLAHMGRRDEALRELEATVAECEGLVRDARRLDILAHLAEAAHLLGDAERARTLQKRLADAGIPLSPRLRSLDPETKGAA